MSLVNVLRRFRLENVELFGEDKEVFMEFAVPHNFHHLVIVFILRKHELLRRQYKTQLLKNNLVFALGEYLTASTQPISHYGISPHR